ISGVIERFPLSFWKKIGEQSTFYITSKCPQYRSCFMVPPRAQREAFETDHRVPAPVGKPMVPGNDGACLIGRFIHDRVFFYSRPREDDELVCCQCQPTFQIVRSFRVQVRQQSFHTPCFRLNNVLCVTSQQVPGLRARDKCNGTITSQFRSEIAWACKVFAIFGPPLPIYSIAHTQTRTMFRDELARLWPETHLERRGIVTQLHFASTVEDGEGEQEGWGLCLTETRAEHAKSDKRTEFELERFSLQQTVLDID